MPLPVLTTSQMRSWEQATWASGQTEQNVIAQVGLRLAARVRALFPPPRRILILAGKGNNGADASAMLAGLNDYQVQLLKINDPQCGRDELEKALHSEPQLVVDGLFGLGLNRELSPEWAGLIHRINQSGIQTIAIDIPSGFDAELGRSRGACIRADRTITIGAPKMGLLSPEASKFTGCLEVAEDVGLIPCPESSELWWNFPDDFVDFPPRRLAASHKGTYGHLGVVAGSMGFHGAAILSARGAQRAQPGLITLLTQAAVYQPVAAQLQAVMVNTWDSWLAELCSPADSTAPSAEKFSSDPTALNSFTALLFGPGLANAGCEPVLKSLAAWVWEHASQPVVVDASALDWVPAGPATSKALRVITPHPGEAARMLQTTASEVQSDRKSALRRLSGKFGGCWVVLKGAQTLVGRSEGRIFVNSTGNPGLAQGGSGDILAGFIAGYLAQPLLQAQPELLLRHAVWEHGAAADRLSQRRRHWVTEELAGELGAAVGAAAENRAW